MVRGLPQINHVNQVCDNCLAGKQKWATFPSMAKYRAEEKLELVHGDLCGPVMPATLGAKRYFFLLVDDVNCYMWLVLLATKDEALSAFTAFQAWAEADAERKIGTLRTDRGGEFTTRNFDEHCSSKECSNISQLHTRWSRTGSLKEGIKWCWAWLTACLKSCRCRATSGGRP
jgi:hypothetical protein